MSDRISAVKAKMADLKIELKSAFNEAIQDIFTKHPGLELIRWRQYTPYFNDGDECVFRSHHQDDYDVNGQAWGTKRAWQLENAEQADARWEALGKDEHAAIYESISEFMSHWSHDDMKDLFGDHSVVGITKEGIVVDSYDHE